MASKEKPREKMRAVRSADTVVVDGPKKGPQKSKSEGKGAETPPKSED